MPDIDPITREALRRASHMQRHTPPPHPHEEHERPPERPHEKPPEPPSKPPEAHKPEGIFGGALDFLFRDKENAIILMMLVLLMDENTDPTLLLALVYLLI